MKMLTLFTILIAVYLLVGLFLFIKQQDFVYLPQPKVDHPYPIEIFRHQQVSLDVIVLNPGRENAILYFGGNAESVVFNAPDYLRHFPSFSVYLVNYRGYGGSSGSPAEQALYADALFIFDQLKQRHHHISVVGRSLGSGIATFLASKREIHNLVLVSPYDSIKNVAQGHYPIYPMGLLLKDKYESLHRVKAIKAPTLIVIAERDHVIPFSHSSRIIEAFPSSQVAVKIINGADHNNFLNLDEYMLTLKAFLSDGK